MWSSLVKAIRLAVDAARSTVPAPLDSANADEHDEGPIIGVDLSHWDGAAPPMVFDHRFEPMPDGRRPDLGFAILKLTDGTVYRHAEWAARNWPRARAAFGDRLGRGAWVGLYHFQRFTLPGSVQADYFLRWADRLGVDWDDGTVMLPVVDVEWTDGNRLATTRQIVDSVAGFCRKVGGVTGRPVMGYGGRLVTMERGIDPADLGVATWWAASYTRTMRRGKLDPIDLWQYAGKREGGVFRRLPLRAPGIGPCDMNVYVGPDGRRGFARRLVRGQLAPAPIHP